MPRPAMSRHASSVARVVRAGSRHVRRLAAACPIAAALAIAVGLAAPRVEAAPRIAQVHVADTGATVVLVMRHAERAGEPGSDPGLSEAGAERARQLAIAAGESGVSVILTTQYARTLDTAAPLAAATGAAVVARAVTPANAGSYAADLAREIRAEHAGRTVAVIGHSNTVPAIVAALTGGAAPTLGEGDYGDLFVIVLPAADGPARLLRTRVGR